MDWNKKMKWSFSGCYVYSQITKTNYLLFVNSLLSIHCSKYWDKKGIKVFSR